MRILAILAVLLALVGGGVYYMQTGPLSKVPLGSLVTADARTIVDLSRKFMEDIQFKDFKKAAQYSLPEHRDMNMPKLIERLFQIKPELLDIQNIQVLNQDFDSTGDRARVYLQADVKVLNTQELRKPNIILYWKREPDKNWYMDLASSLK